MPDIPTIHTTLGYILTGWLALNAGITIGAWWTAHQAERKTIERRLAGLK